MKKDRYHDTVVRALTKDGWTITKEQFALKTDQRRLFVDLEASQLETRVVILVEIKGVEGDPSPINNFYNAVGQYLTYRDIVEVLELKRDLYLAIPNTAYDGIFEEDIGRNMIKNFHIHLIVFDPILEVIVKWIRQ